MDKTFFNLLKQVDSEIQLVESQESDVIKSSKKIVNLLEHALSELKSIVIGFDFQNDEEEIHFFKDIKPMLMSKIIYYNSIYCFELSFPNGSEDVERQYIVSELDKLTAFFDDNLIFYQYYRTNSTYLDEKYFLRGKPDIRIIVDNFCFETDPQFSTSYDFKVSKILANELLRIYLMNRLQTIDKEEKRRKLQRNCGTGAIKWTGTKRALVELIYSIDTSGDFNKGNVDIKEIAAYFETVFDVDIGDYYHIYMEMKGRKINRTRYLDSLRNGLLKRMEEQDG